MASVTSRDRYLAVLRHEEPDRVPLDLPFQPPYPAPEGYGWEDMGGMYQSVAKVGGDPIVDIWLPDPHFDDRVVVRSGDAVDPEHGPIVWAEYQTPAGAVRQVVRKTEDWDGPEHQFVWQPYTMGTDDRPDGLRVQFFDDWNVSRCITPLVRGPEDLPALRYLLQPPRGEVLARWREAAGAARKLAEELGALLRVRRTFAADAFQWFCRIDDFLVDTIERPDYVREFLRIVQDWSLKLLDLSLEFGPDVVMRRAWYETPDYWGGQRFVDMIAPHVEEDAERVHQAGAHLCYQRTQGNTSQIEYLKQTSLDAIWAIDPLHGQEDLGKLKRELGGRLTFWGGVSGVQTLKGGDRKALEEEVRTAIRTLAPGGGFILMPVHAIECDTKWEDVLYLVELVRRHGRYPISA